MLEDVSAYVHIALVGAHAGHAMAAVVTVIHVRVIHCGLIDRACEFKQIIHCAISPAGVDDAFVSGHGPGYQRRGTRHQQSLALDVVGSCNPSSEL
jgi:hypothetical protein